MPRACNWNLPNAQLVLLKILILYSIFPQNVDGCQGCPCSRIPHVFELLNFQVFEISKNNVLELFEVIWNWFGNSNLDFTLGNPKTLHVYVFRT